MAKNLYVNGATGNDSTTYANNDSANPWATIERAAWGSNTYASPNTDEAAKAGDTVIISAGTYTVNSGDNGRWGVAYCPANSGTSGSPITFRGIGTVALRMSSNSRGPVIGSQGRDYIVWDHFYIDDYYCGSHSDTGPVVLGGATGCKLLNCEIKGLGDTANYENGDAAFTNNYNGVRLEPATSCTVSNNLIYNIGPSDGGNENDAGIMTYKADQCIIEHNEIYDCGSGVFIKGYEFNTNNIIRLNNIYSCSHSGVYLYWYSEHTKVYQNIIRDCNSGSSSAGVAVAPDNATYHHGNQIVNNVIENCTGGIRGGEVPTGCESVYQNNIILNCDETWWSGSETPGENTSEHNAYYNNTLMFYSEAADNRDWAYWIGTFAKDTVSPAGINQDPLFMDLTNHLYKLTASSPAKSLGVDILDLDGDSSTSDNVDAGAYITGLEQIGRYKNGSTNGTSNSVIGKVCGVPINELSKIAGMTL